MISGRKNRIRKEISLHILFWATWIISFSIIQGMGGGANEYFVWLMYYIITLPIFMVHTYLVAYWLLPDTFFKGNYWLAFMGIFVFLIIFSTAELVVSNEVVFKLFDQRKVFAPGYLNIKNVIISGIGNHYIIFIFLAIHVGRSWYLSKNKKEELLQLKMETELEIYRYQLQPKLILSLIEEMELITKKSPEKVPGLIVKISGFLNRFLFDGKEDLIPLQLDVQLLGEFIEIHKHALGDRLSSNFVVNGKLQSHVVPPLLLLPFINDTIKIAYLCNKSFESTVIIKAEKKYLLFTFSFWSEEEFRVTENENVEITKNRLKYGLPGKHRLIENIDENFIEYSLEIFN